MTNIYNLFKFLEDKKGKPIPFEVKLIHAPETLTKEDLNVEGSLNLASTPISSLPDNLTVKGNLYLTNTPISSLPYNLTVGGSLFLVKTSLAEKYSEEQIRKMIEEKGGKVEGTIHT